MDNADMQERADGPADYRARAVAHFNEEEISEGRTILAEGLSKFPRDVSLHILLVKHLIRSGEVEAASSRLRRVASMLPSGSAADGTFASLCLESAMPLDASFWLPRARFTVCAAPDSVPAMAVLAELLLACRHAGIGEVGPVDFRRASRWLMVAWCVERKRTFPSGVFQAVVDFKADAAAQRDHRLQLAASALLGGEVGRALCRQWYGDPVDYRIRGDRALIQLGGVKVVFALTNPSLRFHFRHFFLFEPGLLRHLSRLRQGSTFLDIGANVGKYTVLAAALGLRVDAVEPFARNVDALRANVALNRLDERVAVHHVALSDRSGEGWVAYDNEKAGSTNQSISDDIATDPRPGACHKDRLPVWRVDEMVARGLIAFPNHVKIDVDGIEHKVLTGMAGILSDPRLESIRLEIRLEDPRNKRALGAILAHGFVARVDDDRKNLLLTRS